MEADLHAIIRSGQPLTDQHFQSFIYQTLCGLLVSGIFDRLVYRQIPLCACISREENLSTCSYCLLPYDPSFRSLDPGTTFPSSY